MENCPTFPPYSGNKEGDPFDQRTEKKATNYLDRHIGKMDTEKQCITN
jgi:hypothetical protein